MDEFPNDDELAELQEIYDQPTTQPNSHIPPVKNTLTSSHPSGNISQRVIEDAGDYPDDDEMAELQEMYDQPTTQPNAQIPPQKSTPAADRNDTSFFQNNSQLSQITTDTMVNRRLFGTPINGNQARLASTPFPLSNPTDTPNLHRFRLADEPLIENTQRVNDGNVRKRRLDNLFGDINDIIHEEEIAQVYYSENFEENAKKKARSEEEIDKELIQRILSARAELQARTSNFTKQSKLQQLEALQKFKSKNLSENYPLWPSIPIVSNDQNRIYVRMHSEEFETNQLNELSLQKKFNKLLGSSVDNLWNEAQKIVEKRRTAVPRPIQDTECDDVVIVSETKSNAAKLWVDKYRPKNYFELLSDESTNRSLLTWLKMWDKIVFNRNFQHEKTVAEAQKQSASNFNKRTGRFEVGSVRFRKYRQNDLKTEMDSYGRPVQKIAVLCGPPGLGKTTLAHTIARHAGYSVREINASDDRSPEAFRLALQNGTEMQTTLLDQEQRPNCIILDEIDGAPLASIEFLIRFANDQTKESKKSKTTAEKSGKKPSGILRRPIICICNDIYTPSLRPLRQMAFIVTFPPLDSARLAERLLAIARRERLKSDMTTLLALAEKSGNDVRSCISVLQFYANSRKPLELVDVMKSNIGDKDKQKGLFEIWSSVFHIRRNKDGANPTETKAITNGDDTVIHVPSTNTSLRARVEDVLGVVHLGGDSDRLINGVFENYLTQKMSDSTFGGIAEALEWFCFDDLLQTQIQSQQNYSVYPYLSYGFAAWHLLFASIAWPKIVFPTQSFEHYQKSSTHTSIRTAFAKNMTVMIRSLSTPKVISDAIPAIRQIICPTLRSVSLQLLSPKERYDLQHTVDVMVDLGLTYSQMKNVDGTYQYQIEPDINSLSNFKVNERTNELTYSNMQIIAREVEIETMKRSAPKQSSNKTTTTKDAQAKAFVKPKPQNHLQRLNTKGIKTKAKDVVTKDFFGRIVEKQFNPLAPDNDRDELVKSPIWYQYKEGFNNAVRKDVTLQSLL